MLAQSASSIEEAIERMPADAAVDWKVDGIRIQVHRDGDEVAVYTRTLDAITDRVPEIVEAVRALPASQVVLDGEAIAIGSDGRPRPFQETAARAATRAAAGPGAPQLTPFFFDVLHLDGADVMDRPGRERLAALDLLVPAAWRVPRTVVADVEAASRWFAAALAAGHEGVVFKALDAPYEAGRRGASWLKVKPRHTLDLVVLAAEWGHGRRAGWLSNLHLGARDPDTGTYVMLGKTFKGMTDALLEWQTGQLLARQTSTERGVVFVRPELVVEIAFDGIQTSRRYPGGMALRFARVLRYRPDKTAEEADTVEAVRQLR
jgi:DNA ligase-1